MNLLSFLFPQIVEKINSPINGEIKVVKLFGNISLQVDGLTQSGGLLENIWKKGLKEIKNSKLKIKNCLLLGVGGGTVIKLLYKYFPQIKITGVEIDPLMLQLAQKYFAINEIPRLKLINSDAIRWVKNFRFNDINHCSMFDLILVDLYTGKDIPKELNDIQFLIKLRSLLSKNGMIIFNRLRNKDNQKEIDEFIEKVKSIFSRVLVKKPLVNYLIFCG